MVSILRKIFLEHQLTSFFKVVFDIVILAHDVCMSSNANINSIFIENLPIVELVVELVGCGVKRVSNSILVIAIVIIKNGSLANRHSDDRAAMLVSAPGAPVTVTALRTQQDGGDVVDLMGGFCAGTFLWNPATLTPSMTGIQDQGEEEN